MATRVGPRVLDFGLNVLDTESTHIHICSAEPTDFTNVASVTLGNKNFGAGNVTGSPTTGSGNANSRKVATAAVTDGTVTAGGTGTHWAITDQTNSRLNATGPLPVPLVVVSGSQWTIGSFEIELNGQTT